MDYIQEVPEHCDRIVWRGSYYHLPLVTPSTVLLHDEITRLQADNKRLEAEVENLKDSFTRSTCRRVDTSRELNQQLAAAQLENQKLREIILKLGHAYWCRVNAGGDECTCGADEALSATPQTDALTAYRNDVLENFLYKFRRHVGGDGEFWLHELDCFYEDMKKEIQE